MRGGNDLTGDEIHERALALLTRREHSRRELESKLARQAGQTSAVGDILDALERSGMLSDTRFASCYTESRARRGFGPLRILAELEQRGIDKAAREAACTPSSREWLVRAREARDKRFGATAPRDFKERARQARFLTQRGFGPSHVSHALRASAADPD